MRRRKEDFGSVQGKLIGNNVTISPGEYELMMYSHIEGGERSQGLKK